MHQPSITSHIILKSRATLGRARLLLILMAIISITSYQHHALLVFCEAADTHHKASITSFIPHLPIHQSQQNKERIHVNDVNYGIGTSSTRLGFHRSNSAIRVSRARARARAPSRSTSFAPQVKINSSFQSLPSTTTLQSTITSTDESTKQDSSATPTPYSLKSYSHKGGWDNVTYLYQPATPGYENAPPLVLIHPVGIGISSWFWTRVMKCMANMEEGQPGGHPAIYAVDLLGCNLESGANAWYPANNGLFFPLSWVEGVETLIQDVVLPNKGNGKGEKSGRSSEGFFSNLFQTQGGGDGGSVDGGSDDGGSGDDEGCVVICQGGLAPVGVMLASRNPSNVVSKLMLTSPPTWTDMTTPVPSEELERNYNFLCSKPWGEWAFSLLETRRSVQLFSNLFLFSEECDEEWLALTAVGSQDPRARTPIQAFNAGLCNHRSFEEEMKSLEQPALIVGGRDDKRQALREPYEQEMKKCKLLTMEEGLNVVPWENPEALVRVIQDFVSK